MVKCTNWPLKVNHQIILPVWGLFHSFFRRLPHCALQTIIRGLPVIFCEWGTGKKSVQTCRGRFTKRTQIKAIHLQCFQEGCIPQYVFDLLSRPNTKPNNLGVTKPNQPGGYQTSSEGWARKLYKLAGLIYQTQKCCLQEGFNPHVARVSRRLDFSENKHKQSLTRNKSAARMAVLRQYAK